MPRAPSGEMNREESPETSRFAVVRQRIDEKKARQIAGAQKSIRAPRGVECYFFAPPSAPAVHPVHTPNPLALARMLAHRPVRLASSCVESTTGRKRVSVVAKLPVGGAAWSVVPKAANPPVTRFGGVVPAV